PKGKSSPRSSTPKSSPSRNSASSAARKGTAPTPSPSSPGAPSAKSASVSSPSCRTKSSGKFSLQRGGKIPLVEDKSRGDVAGQADGEEDQVIAQGPRFEETSGGIVESQRPGVLRGVDGGGDEFLRLVGSE